MGWAQLSVFSFTYNHLSTSATALQDRIFDFALGQELFFSINNNKKKSPPDFQAFGWWLFFSAGAIAAGDTLLITLFCFMHQHCSNTLKSCRSLAETLR